MLFVAFHVFILYCLIMIFRLFNDIVYLVFSDHIGILENFLHFLFCPFLVYVNMCLCVQLTKTRNKYATCNFSIFEEKFLDWSVEMRQYFSIQISIWGFINNNNQICLFLQNFPNWGHSLQKKGKEMEALHHYPWRASKLKACLRLSEQYHISKDYCYCNSFNNRTLQVWICFPLPPFAFMWTRERLVWYMFSNFLAWFQAPLICPFIYFIYYYFMLPISLIRWH